MTMMLQGTDFERLDRVDSRRARTAGSGSSIAGRASRRRRRPFIASGKARPHSAVDPLFERQATPWLLTRG